MKNIKTLALLAVAAFGLAASSHAAQEPNRVNAPLNQQGLEAHPDNVGYLHMRNSGTTEMIVCSGRCLLKALIMSTGPTASYISVRNTSVAQGNGALVLGKYLRFAPLVASGTGDKNPVVAPILLDKGISITLSSVTADEDVTILYRDLD